MKNKIILNNIKPGTRNQSDYGMFRSGKKH